jgi:hypothetical protein
MTHAYATSEAATAITIINNTAITGEIARTERNTLVLALRKNSLNSLNLPSISVNELKRQTRRFILYNQIS